MKSNSGLFFSFTRLIQDRCLAPETGENIVRKDEEVSL
jgi:hypothetical protein